MSIYAALEFEVPVSPALLTKSFPVKFWGGGNDFAGVFIVDEFASISSQSVVFNGSTPATTLTCKKQIKGYYFNAARGAWLLPLSSNQGGKVSWLYMTGWVYTSCEWSLTDIVGSVTYSTLPITNIATANLGTVVFWTDISDSNKQDNSYGLWAYKKWAISWNSVWLKLQVNWLFFDSMLGIGEVKSDNVDATSPLITTAWGDAVADLIWAFNKIYVQWNIGIGKSVDSSEREVLTISLAGTKTLLTSSDEIIASTIINTVEKNKAKQCRNGAGSKWNFLCVDAGGLFVLDSTNINNYENKDVVFTNGDVFIDESVYKWYKDNNYKKTLSIYIPQGNLILDSDISDINRLTAVDKNGFQISGIGQSKWLYLVGNFIVNGIILGAIDQTNALNKSYTTIPFKTFVHGKLSSLNTFTTVSSQRIKLLTNLMATRATTYNDFVANSLLWSYFEDGQWNASMENLFNWKCATTTIPLIQTWGMGALPIGSGPFTQTTLDAVRSISCPTASEWYPLVIIEKNIPTQFFVK